MKRCVAIGCTLACVSILGAAVVAPSASDDAADIREASLAILAGLRAGDVDSLMEGHLPKYSIFDANGGLLAEFDERALKKLFEGGFKYDRSWRHLEVKVYGNSGICTGYAVGTTTWPDYVAQTPERFSLVWIKQQGTWRIAHVHVSPLTQR